MKGKGSSNTTASIRVPTMPKKIQEMIRSIKEIAGSHSDEEIHAMLKECSMDPNEAAQKLLSQDPFHEVRRKRDKKKEILNNKELPRPRIQGRGGRGIISPSPSPKQNGVKDVSSSSSTNLANGRARRVSPPIASVPSPSQLNPTSISHNSPPPASLLGLHSSATDPVLLPSLHSPHPAVVGTIKRQVPAIESSTSLDTTTHLQIDKIVPPELSPSLNENKPFETPHYSSTSLHGPTSSSRPSSNYATRSQQPIGSQKVGPSKEWKPKPTNPVSSPASSVIDRMGDGGHAIVEAGVLCSVSTPSTISEESTSKLQNKLDELHFAQNQHVIIPDHLQVPEAERSGLSFGSFDANFGLTRCYNYDPDTDKMSTPLSESSQEAEGLAHEPCISNQVESLTTPEGDYSGHPQSPKTVPETSSLVEADVSSSAGHEYEQAKQEIAAPLGGPQYSVVHTAPNYNFGFMPPILGTQFAPFDTSEPQARDASRIPSFVVQQAFDPSASYYTQFYRATGEGDGRFPAANKYNGGGSLESTATSSTTPPPAAVMQQSQQLAIFRQPHLAPPHYPPPNYIPYSSQYFSPQFYMPPPQTIHHYLTTNPAAAAAAFQQPSVYPPPPPPAAAGVKFSVSPQFKLPTTTTTSTTTAASGNEELSSNYNKEYVTGGQQQQQQVSEGSGVWIPGRDIYPSSFYSLSPHQGQHVTFAAAPTTAAFYHQTAQSQQSGVEMYQQQQPHAQPQRAQLNWTANY